jgi:hypothetical protein
LDILSSGQYPWRDVYHRKNTGLCCSDEIEQHVIVRRTIFNIERNRRNSVLWTQFNDRFFVYIVQTT